MNTNGINKDINTQTLWTRPVKSTVFAFLGLMGVIMALAVAQKTGVLEATVEKRVIGLVIGVMVVVTGNFLPKMRPLNTTGGNPAKAAAAERFAGWTLVLAGIAYIALFAFAPLAQARPVSSIIGIGAMLVIAANWAWLARGALSRGRQTAGQTDGATDKDTVALTRQAAEKRRLIVLLLFAFFWVFATAGAAFLFNDKPWVKEVGSWAMVGFSFIYAALTALLDHKWCPK